MQLKFRLKHLPGQHDQKTHGNWAHGVDTQQEEFYSNPDNLAAIQALVNDDYFGKSKITDDTWDAIYKATLTFKTTQNNLQRANLKDKDYSVGDSVVFLGDSFSGLNYTKGDVVSTLRTDYADSIYVIDNPTHGLDIEYNRLSFQGIAGLSNEMETLISGEYKVSRVAKIRNTRGAGNMITVYYLKEEYTTYEDLFRMFNNYEEKGGEGSGFHGHAGRPGKVGGSTSDNDTFGQPVGIHTSEGQQKVIDYLERETGMRFRPHGSLASGNGISNNDIDIAVIEPTEQESEAVWLEDMKREDEMHAKYARGEITLDELSDFIYSTGPDPVSAALGKLGYNYESTAYWRGIAAVRYTNPKTKHNIEVWMASGDPYREEFTNMKEGVAAVITFKGGKGSGHFHHRGRKGKIGGSLPGTLSGTYGPFGEDEEKFKKVNDYIRGNRDGGHSKQYPWSIHGEMRAADTYLKDYKAAEQGMTIYDSGYDENDNWYSNTFDITSDQFNYIYQQVKVEDDARYREVVDAFGFPSSYKDFFAGVDIKDKYPTPYDIPRSEYVMVDEQIAKNVQKYTDNLKNNGYEYSDFSHDEITRMMYATDYDAQMTADDIKSSWLSFVDHHIDEWHSYETRHGISKGEISPEYGSDMGVYDAKSPQGGSWAPLPSTLYHATTNVQAILNDRIRSRREIGQQLGLGLGGGEDDTISFGTDADIVQNIERSLQEAHLVAVGKVGITEMFKLASDGGGGVGHNWAKDLAESIYGGNVNLPDDFEPFGKDADKVPTGLQELFDYESGKKTLANVVEWQRDLYASTEEWKASKRWDIYSLNFGSTRQRLGGFPDPLFFGTDHKGLAKADPDKFATLVYEPISGAMGYQMSSLSEWRTVGGDTVRLVETIDHYKADDYEAVLGWDGIK